MLIGLTGLAGSGKDEVGTRLVEKHGFRRYAFADRIKTALERLNPLVETARLGVAPLLEQLAEVGWDELKREESVRVLLQRFGTEVGRDLLGKDIWVSATMSDLASDGVFVALADGVVTDVRFDNEAVAILDAGGIVVSVVRGVEKINSHSSENGISSDFIMETIENSGTLEELHAKVDSVIGRYHQIEDASDAFAEGLRAERGMP